jgi:hypothetical protein
MVTRSENPGPMGVTKTRLDFSEAPGERTAGAEGGGRMEGGVEGEKSVGLASALPDNGPRSATGPPVKGPRA